MEKTTAAEALDSTSPQTRAFLFMMIIDSIILFSSLFHLTHSFITLLSFLWTVLLSQLKPQRCQLDPNETCISRNSHHNPEYCSIPSYLNEQDCVDDEGVKVSELRMVLGRLGTNWHDEKLWWRSVRADDITAMFEEQEPSVVEAKEAFDVFDENGDGFIDARELRRVLCRLGCHQASSEANCKEMIRAYDKNGDGLVDFHEFMKLVGTSFA